MAAIFPEIMKPGSLTFQRLFIALSKAPSKAKIKNIRQIIKDNITDLSKQQNLIKQSKDNKMLGANK